MHEVRRRRAISLKVGIEPDIEGKLIRSGRRYRKKINKTSRNRVGEARRFRDNCIFKLIIYKRWIKYQMGKGGTRGEMFMHGSRLYYPLPSSREFSVSSFRLSFSARSIFNSISMHSQDSLPPRFRASSSVFPYSCTRLFTLNRYYLKPHRFSSSRPRRRKTRLALEDE